MGWASGSSVAGPIIETVSKEIKDAETRKKVYRPLYEALTGADWDTVDECLGIDTAFDEVVKEYEPEWFDE